MDYRDRSVANEAVQYILATGAPEYQWLFIFVGLLKGRYADVDEARLGPSDFEDVLRYFAEEADHMLPSTVDIVTWSDIDTVWLEFEKAWDSRKFAMDSAFVPRAIAQRDWNVLQLPEYMNSWVRRIITICFWLAEHQPGIPFLFPINLNMSESIDASLRTLSLAIAKAIELDYLKVVEEAGIRGSKRRARRFTFNYDHPNLADKVEPARHQLRRYYESLAASRRSA